MTLQINLVVLLLMYLTTMYNVYYTRKTEGPQAYSRYIGSSAWAEWLTFLSTVSDFTPTFPIFSSKYDVVTCNFDNYESNCR